MVRTLRILILEDSPHDAELAVAELERAGFQAQWARVETREDFTARLRTGEYDIVLADYNLPAFDAVSALNLMHELRMDLPFVLISGTVGEEIAIESLKAGATDYVLKDRILRLGPVVQRALLDLEERRQLHRAEVALRESEVKYKMLFESANDAILLMKGHRFVDCNSRTLTMYGCAREQILGATPEAFSPPKQPDGRLTKERILELVELTLSGKPQFFEWKHRRLNGELFDVEVNLNRVELDGEDYIQAIVRDITQRKKAEAELTRLQEETSRLVGELDVERMYRRLLEAACSIVQADLAVLPLLREDRSQLRHIVAHGARANEIGLQVLLSSVGLWNQAVRRGEPIFVSDLMNTPFMPQAMAKAMGMSTAISLPLVKGERALGAIILFRVEREFTRREGRLLTIFANYAVGLIESAQLYEQVRRAEANYRDLYDNAPDGYGAVNADGVVVTMNATQLNWLGFQPDEVIGEMRFDEFLTPEGRQILNRQVDLCRQGSPTDMVELDFVRKDATRLPVRLNVLAVLDANGQYAGYRVTARDIRKERDLEAQLLQAQKLESLGTLVGGIAHDFNNMLTGILGHTQLLLRQAETHSPLYEGLKRVELLSERAAGLVRQLLTFSREDVSEKKRILLHPFLKEVGKLLERMIPENIEVLLSLAPDEVVVEADPTQLQQVLMNLVVNARDAMPGGGQLRVETAVVDLDETFCQRHADLLPGEYVKLDIKDTGIGIPDEIRARIFDPFFTTKEAGKGTGLGLPVVYGIVTKHNGTIELESEIGEGTTFNIYLPLMYLSTKDEPMPEETPIPIEVGQGTETILLIEDEPKVLELGQLVLTDFGYRVLTARDGLEGLEVYKERRGEISLVILDMVMPRLGGLETLAELRKINPQVRVLVATGYSSKMDVNLDDLGDEVCGVVRKPYSVYEFARVVRSALDQPTEPLGKKSHPRIKG